MVLAAAAAGAQSIDGLPDSRFLEQRETFTPASGAPIELRFLIAREAGGQTTRVVDATRATLAMLSEWFGPLPAPSLTVAGVPWPGSVTVARPGIVTAPLRWLAPVRDQSMERALIAAIVRQYWPAAGAPAPFEEALIVYTGTRAIHHLLEGSNFETPRFFGGIVPFPLRSVLLSPPVGDPRPRVRDFDELALPADRADEVQRGVRALQTLERYAGWPALLEALSRMRESGRRDAEGFAAALSQVRGTDLRSLVAECLRADVVFDYSLDSLQSAAGAAGLIETTVTISRRGSGRFAIGEDAGDRDSTMPLLVRFADGKEARDYFDGAAPSSTFVYSAATAAIAAAVDPDAMLLLDVDRDNNAIVPDVPASRLGIRLALNWMAWLQNAMLELHGAVMRSAVSPIRALLQGLADVLKAPLMVIAIALATLVIALPFAATLAVDLQTVAVGPAACVAGGDRDRS